MENSTKRKRSEDRGIIERKLKTGETVFDVRLWHGRRAVMVGGFRSKQLARKMYRRAKVEQDQGIFDPNKYQRRGGPRCTPATMTVKEYADQWLAERRRKYKPTTWESYRSILTYKIIPTLGHLSLSVVNRERVKEFLLDELDRKTAAGKEISLKTVKNTIKVLSRVLNSAYLDEFIPRNYAMDLKDLMGSPAQYLVVPLSTDEEQRFLQAVRAYQIEWYPFFFLLLRAGLRIGEALALRVEDILFEERQILVRRIWSTGGLQDNTKSNKERRVDMSQKLTAVFRDHIDRLTREAELQWKPAPTWLFEGLRALPYTQQYVRRSIFQPILRETGLRKFRIHDLRHTFATRLLLQGDSRGVTLKYVSTMLGHRSIAITADTYTHLIPGNLRWAVDLLDEIPSSNGCCTTCGHPLPPTASPTATQDRVAA
ncbi:MAG: site-specific integrase [Nitrospira sp.]|nr:site-specific integrase [Nitrospira sp.]MBX3337200.1 site-specific integrase [Nitrospira sp.]MCW5780210.1 site-specific integrase [Nitrospira sp.]